MDGRCHTAAEPGVLDLDSIGWFVAFAAAVLAVVVADLAGPLTPQAHGAACFAILAAITYRTWRQTEQGNHPIFLFMLFLMLFQFGRLFSWLVFGEWSIAEFDLAVARAFTVGAAELKRSMLLVPLSAAFVYLGFFARAGRKVLVFPRDDDMRRFFGWLFFLTIPFVIYKDVSYLRYTLEHGGYIATYLGEGEHLQQVGIPMRALALLNTMAFLPYIAVETRKGHLLLAIAVFLLVMILELLVGFRGKFFMNLMFLWMVFNVKRGSSFKPLTGLIGALALIAAAIGAEIFRESKAGLDVNLVEYFLRTQGVSFFVTVSSVMHYEVFHPHVWSYLLHQFWLPYQHLSRFGEGSLLTLDLTAFLNPHIVSYALGTGESYLAQLYLIGREPAVCLGSLLLGLFCLAVSRARSVFGCTLALAILLWVPYLPRSGYLEPLAMSTKYFIMALVGFGGYAVFAWLRANLRARSRLEAAVA